MANEFGRWFVRNDPQTWRKKLGAYKRPFDERYQRPAEYTPSVEEYSHYPAMKDFVAEQEEKKKEFERSDTLKRSDNVKTQSKTAKNVGQKVGNIVKNVAGRAVAAVVGSVIVVSGYEAIVAEKAAGIEDITPIAQVVADWDDWDSSDLTITVILKDADGNVVKEIPAEITMTEVPATCKNDGIITYTATALDGDKEYSDTYSETIPAIEHRWDGGTTETDEDGNSFVIYKCQECHEKFMIGASATENDN